MLVKDFDNLTFTEIDGKTPGLNLTAVVKNKTAIVQQAAEYIQEDILEYALKLDHPARPPSDK